MSKNAPTHTFVIPAYKESSFLDDCIQSLLNQTVKSKIIIATSTPNDFITQIAERYNIPVKVNTGKAGIGLDWNFALSCCDTQYCTLAHQDDLYLPLYTEKMLKAMSRDHDSGIAFCDYSDLKQKE
jgi:glycosyltransferase involved in cell wall biosynthesis